MINWLSLSLKNIGAGGKGSFNKRGVNIFLPMKRGGLSQGGQNREFLIITVNTNLLSSAIGINHLEAPNLIFYLTKHMWSCSFEMTPYVEALVYSWLNSKLRKCNLKFDYDMKFFFQSSYSFTDVLRLTAARTKRWKTNFPCLVPLQRFPRSSRSIHFSDVAESKERDQTTWPETFWPCGIPSPSS